jgi:hypothetical protein
MSHYGCECNGDVSQAIAVIESCGILAYILEDLFAYESLAILAFLAISRIPAAFHPQP